MRIWVALAVMLAGCATVDPSRTLTETTLERAACMNKGQSCNVTLVGKDCCPGATCIGSNGLPATAAGNCKATSTTPTTTPSTTLPSTPTTTVVTTTIPPTPTTTLPPSGPYSTDDGPPTRARFPTGRDVSVLIPHDQQCRWWLEDGVFRTATQAERAAMFLHGTAILTPAARLYWKYNPSCVQLFTPASGEFQTDNLRLRPGYIDTFRDSEWSIEGGNGCDPYSHTEHMLRDVRRCSLSSVKAKEACAASPFMTADLLDAAAMKRVNGRCEDGATYTLPPFPAKEDPELKHRGHLLYRIPLSPLPAACRAKARCVGALHMAGSNRKCGVTAPPLPAGCSGSVSDAELALLQCAPTEKWKHALLMLFPTFVDTQRADQPAGSGWSQQDVCDLAQLEHHAWMAWDACLDMTPASPSAADSQWACLTRARVSHETWHIIAAGRHPSTQFRIGNHVTTVMDVPGRSQDAWLRLVRTDPARGGLVWVPPNWQVPLPVEHMP